MAEQALRQGIGCDPLDASDIGEKTEDEFLNDLQCSYPSRKLIKIITLYQPDAELWIDNRIRKANLVGDK